MSRGVFFALLVFAFPIQGFCQAAENGGSEASKMLDARDYMDSVEKLKEAPVDKQISGWRQFLIDHPDTTFRNEIEDNVRNLENMRTETDPVRKQEARDTERYLRAVEFSKTLTLDDQIAMWEQFLEENPKTLYKKEVTTTLEGLKAKRGAVPPPAGRQAVGAPRREEPVVSHLAFVDPQTATLLATFPGLVVPGMGHWYTKDYTVASVLTALRVGAVAFGIPGIVQQNTTMIIAASVIYGFTYLVDAIDAPFSAHRYNDELEQGSPSSLKLENSSGGWTAGLQYTFTF